MGEVIVRRARLEDAARLVELYEALAQDEPSALPADLARAAAILSEAIDDQARHLVVAELEGAVVRLDVVPRGWSGQGRARRLQVPACRSRCLAGRPLCPHRLEA